MNDQEYDNKLAELMSEEPSAKKKKPEKKGKKKIIIGVAAVAAALIVVYMLLGPKKATGLPVMTDTLTKGEVEEFLSISGPVSGTDSAEVVSRLHAEILEILVKEGDKVEKGQILARLDPTDVQKEVDIAQNAYDLAVANREEAQLDAENGYAKALQDLRAAQLDHDRKAVLFAAGDIAQAEMEAARDALSDANRQVRTYTLRDGKAVANESYNLQVKNAEFELEQKKKQLEEAEVTSPITGTVVRVNSRVGRFADTVDEDKPLFAIDNLENLEMKINVSEYSIGKIRVGQTAEITADILDGEVETGVIAAISPTGEEKGGGSTERVIPTTIRIESQDTKLIAGITARAKIVMNRAEDAWTVPVSAVQQREDGSSYIAVVEDGLVKLVTVETGVEGDLSIEIIGEDLAEGLTYITTPDATLLDGVAVTVMPPG